MVRSSHHGSGCGMLRSAQERDHFPGLGVWEGSHTPENKRGPLQLEHTAAHTKQKGWHIAIVTMETATNLSMHPDSKSSQEC